MSDADIVQLRDQIEALDTATAAAQLGEDGDSGAAEAGSVDQWPASSGSISQAGPSASQRKRPNTMNLEGTNQGVSVFNEAHRHI